MPKRPLYEALDRQGLPYMRPAKVIGELPTADVAAATDSATQQIAKMLNMSAVRCIQYGAPVFVAFGLTRNQAKQHSLADLLLTRGDEVPLDHCPVYDAAE